MNLPNLFFRLIVCAGFFVLLPENTFAHGDEIPTDPGVATDHFTSYGQSDRYELTLYYPELEAGMDARLTLYIADFKSNEPIDKAGLKVILMEKPDISFKAIALSPGIYELQGAFPENKSYTLNLEINHPKGADLIGVSGIRVGEKLHEDEISDDGQPAGGSSWLWFIGGLILGGLVVWAIGFRRKRVLTLILLLASAWGTSPDFNPVFAHDGETHGPPQKGSSLGKTVYSPKETQFLFEILTQPIAINDYQSTTTMFGTVVPASGGLGAVIAPQAGRLLDLKVSVGQRVDAGQTLATLQQNVSTPDQVSIAANNAALAVQIETAKTRLVAAKREYERLKKIEDIAAGRDVQAAEANYDAARVELQTLEKRALGANSTANGRTIALVAPIGGIVGAFTLTRGAEVVAGQTLFTVTNLGKVYVEAQVYDRDVPVVRSGNKFLVTCSTDDHKSAEVRLISQAQSMNPGNQSQRVLFEMDNPLGEFKIGEFVTVKALDNSRSRQITVPNSALTEINGKTAVFLKHAPEEYELAYVQTGEDDGTRTLILKGIEEGEKVVVKGAYEVKMMYLNN